MKSIRQEYVETGVENFYRSQGSNYRNPHESSVMSGLQEAASLWSLNLINVLDLACGSGEATLALQAPGRVFTGADPFTEVAYETRIGRKALKLSFEDIANGKLSNSKYSLIICSYAMHLVDESRLPLLCFRLSEISPARVIVTPHKRPLIKSLMWRLMDEFVYEHARFRYYRSNGE